MASIHPKGEGYVVRWREGGRGSRLRSSPILANLKKAGAYKRAIEAQLAAQRPHDGVRPIPIAELISRYLLDRADSTEDHRAKARRILDQVVAANGWEVAGDIRPDAAAGLKTHQRRLVRALLRFAAEAGQRVDPIAITRLRPKSPRRMPQVALSDARVAELVAKAGKWHPADGAVAHLIATYGHRAESVVGLTPAALTSRPGWLRLRVKSGDIHEHPLLPASAKLLGKLAADVDPDKPFLIGHHGRAWKSGSEFAIWWAHEIAEGAKGAGILDLRRYAISRMMSATGDPKTVASITGHRTPSLLLNVYARTDETRQRAALAALKCSPRVPSKSHKSLKGP